MKRRAFIAALGGAAVWPLAARAQKRMPRIAVLLNYTKQTGQPLLATMLEQLRQIGWVPGETAHFDIRWGDGEADHIRKAAADLVALTPDIIVTSSTPPTLVFLEMTCTISKSRVWLDRRSGRIGNC